MANGTTNVSATENLCCLVVSVQNEKQTDENNVPAISV